METETQIETQYSGSRTTADHWGPPWLASAAATRAEAQKPSTIAENSVPAKPAGVSETTLAALSPLSLTQTGFDCDANEFNWANVFPSDHSYLTAPRTYPSPCSWCGGQLRHNRLCNALRASWQPAMPFGKYAGKQLSQVPRDYLEWFIRRDGIDAALSDAIRTLLAERR